MPLRLRSLAFALAFALPAACSSKSEPESSAAPINARTVVQVENRNFYDMQIYAERFGERQRLGLATGNRTTTFELPPHWTTGATVRFVASPVGSDKAGWSQDFTVRPGDVVRLEIN